jgi:hypothetical protein
MAAKFNGDGGVKALAYMQRLKAAMSAEQVDLLNSTAPLPDLILVEANIAGHRSAISALQTSFKAAGHLQKAENESLKTNNTFLEGDLAVKAEKLKRS